jgi:4-amino-4-deoxy-L-arabinose transferase-like glycosyltransferase
VRWSDLEKRYPLRPSSVDQQGARWRAPQAASRAQLTPLFLLLALSVSTLVTFATVTSAWAPLHHDMTEAWAWGKEFQLGYAKHPPLSAWVVGLWFAVMPRTDWSFYLLSGLNIAVALAGVWMLAGIFLGTFGRAASVLFLMLTPSFSLWALKFNVNAPLISAWPWTTYFFLRSLATRRMDFSVYAGLLGGIALLTKYYSLVLFGTLLLVAALHPDRLRYFTSPAPYVTNAVGLLVITPHVWWTFAADLPTIDYAISKTHYGVAEARSTAIGSVAGAIAALGFACAAYALAFGAQTWALLKRSLIAAFDRRNAWLTCFAHGPLIFTIAAYFVFNARITIGFLLPAFFALPTTFLVLSRAEVTAVVVRRLVYGVAAVWVTMVAASPLFAYYQFAYGPQAMLEPRRELAIEATRIWNATFARRLRFVSGEQRLATAVTFYSPDSPSYLILDKPEQSPWVADAEAKMEGVLILCREEAEACMQNAARYAGERAIRSTHEFAAKFFGRAAASQRFVFIVRPPD